MRKEILVAGGVGIGLGLMYVLDPERGRRRRATLRDRTSHALRSTRVTLGKKAQDLGNRARGLAAEARTALRREPVSDVVLEQRVRSQLGRAVSKPCDVEALAAGGGVTLRGVVRAGEVERLLRRVSRVRGVRSVESQLNVKGLHAAGHANGEAGGNNGTNHTPDRPSMSARLLATVAGGGLAFYGVRRKGVFGSLAGVVGMKMLRRAFPPHHGNGVAAG